MSGRAGPTSDFQSEGDFAIFRAFAHGDLAFGGLAEIVRHSGGLRFFAGPNGANYFFRLIVFEKNYRESHICSQLLSSFCLVDIGQKRLQEQSAKAGPYAKSAPKRP